MKFRNLALMVSTLALMFSVLHASPVRADDAEARVLMEQGNALWDKRLDLTQVQPALDKFTAAVATATDSLLKYDLSVKISNAYYYQGLFARTDNDKMAIHDKGMAAANVAKALSDDYAEAYYFYAINLGRWALAKGVLASLQRKGELIKSAENAIERVARDGTDGEAYDGYGPHRVLGRMYFKLPGFAGGSRDKALKAFELAYVKAPIQALNVVYLAEALNDGSAADKARARKLLDDMLAFERSPETFNAARIPETVYEFGEARQLRREMGR